MFLIKRLVIMFLSREELGIKSNERLFSTRGWFGTPDHFSNRRVHGIALLWEAFEHASIHEFIEGFWWRFGHGQGRPLWKRLGFWRKYRQGPEGVACGEGQPLDRDGNGCLQRAGSRVGQMGRRQQGGERLTQMSPEGCII